MELCIGSDFTVAIAAVNRPVTTRLKRHFSILTAFSAYHREHLASGTVVAISVTL